MEKEIAKDLRKVFEEAKLMGRKEVKAFTHIPLENVKAVIDALDKQPILMGLLEEATEEIENCYGRETELSKRIRKQLT